MRGRRKIWEHRFVGSTIRKCHWKGRTYSEWGGRNCQSLGRGSFVLQVVDHIHVLLGVEAQGTLQIVDEQHCERRGET